MRHLQPWQCLFSLKLSVDSGYEMRHLPAWVMSGDRDFFGSVLSGWISFAQIKQPIFGVFLNVTLLLFL